MSKFIKKFKRFSKKDKKNFRELIKALHCPRDCEKCKKSIEQCLLDIRICLDMLLKTRLQTTKKIREKSDEASAMVS